MLYLNLNNYFVEPLKNLHLNNFFLHTFQEEEETSLTDATEIVAGKPYHWRDWYIVRGRDCLYLWSEGTALELSNGSNGWFRFILDGKLATMYSSGSPEGGSDSTGNLTFFHNLNVP